MTESDQLLELASQPQEEALELNFPGHWAVPAHVHRVNFSTRQKLRIWAYSIVPFTVIFFFLKPAYVLTMGFVFALLGYIIFAAVFMDHTVIRISKDSIRFPWFFIKRLGGRLHFQWHDFLNITLFESSTATRGHRLRFTLNNGRNAELELIRLSKEDLNKLLDFLQTNNLSLISDPNMLDDIKKWYEFEKGNSQAYAALESDTCRAPGELGLQLYEHRRPGEDFSSAPHSVASVLSAGGISASYVCKCNHQEPHIIKDYWLDWLDEDAKWSLIGELSDICQTINQKIGIRPMVPNQWWPDADRFNVSMPSNRELSREISLREAVVGKAKLKPARIRKILLDLARQIEELHNLGGKYYHGALDPETIYLTKKLKVSIVEPPRIRSRLMELSKRILIPMHTYIAPEQFKKEPSRASDCYSLGKIAYFMLYGCDPESVVHIDHWAAFSGDLHVIDEIIRKTTTTDATQRPSIFQLVEWLAGQSLLLESEPLALGSLTDDL